MTEIFDHMNVFCPPVPNSPTPTVMLALPNTPGTALAYVLNLANFKNRTEQGDALEEYLELVFIPAYWPGATEIIVTGGAPDPIASGQHRADVVFEHNGRVYFVQAKHYGKKLSDPTVNKIRQDFEDRKVPEAGGFTDLVIVAPWGLSRNADESLKRTGGIVIGRGDLKAVDIPMGELEARRAAVRPIEVPPAPVVPADWNQAAIAALTAEVLDGDRFQIYRATGTGKTVVQANVIKSLGEDLTLVLVPSIDLVGQQIKSYARDLAGLGYHFMGVCSKARLFSKKDRRRYGHLIEGVAITNTVSVVMDFLQREGPKVLVTTYHSTDVVAEAADGMEFGLGIFDEAHRTATTDTSHFNAAIHDHHIKIRRRDYYTATPRIADPDLVALNAAQGNPVDIHSMDDEALYGKEIRAARLTLSEAIDIQAVAPFDVIVGVMTDQTIRDGYVYPIKGKRQSVLFTNRYTGPMVSITDVAQALFFLAQCEPGCSYLTFHSDTTKARRMKQLLEEVADELRLTVKVASVDWDSGSKERSDAIDMLDQKDPDAIHIVTNCQLFGEGVDAPGLDGVCFFDPKSSVRAIGQAIGRPLRIHSNPNKRAKVIIPVFAENALSAEDFVRESRYAFLLTVGEALRDHDVILKDVVTQHSDDVAAITSRQQRRKATLGITIPTLYSHPDLIAAIQATVAQGRDIDPALRRLVVGAPPWIEELIAEAEAHVAAGRRIRAKKTASGYPLATTLTYARNRGAASMTSEDWDRLEAIGFSRYASGPRRFMFELMWWFDHQGGTPDKLKAKVKSASGYQIGDAFIKLRSGNHVWDLTDEQWDQVIVRGLSRTNPKPRNRSQAPAAGLSRVDRNILELEAWVAEGNHPNPSSTTLRGKYSLGYTLAGIRRDIQNGNLTPDSQQLARYAALETDLTPKPVGSGKRGPNKNVVYCGPERGHVKASDMTDEDRQARQDYLNSHAKHAQRLRRASGE